MTKYFVELRNASPWRVVSLRVYRDDPRIHGGAASMEAVKFRNFDTGKLDPAQVKINLALRDGYTVEEANRLIEWINVAREVAAGFDFFIGNVADFDRVLIEPWYDDRLSVDEAQGKITIHFPDTWETL